MPRPSVTAAVSVAAGTAPDGTPVPSHLTLTLDQVLPGRGVYQLRLDPAGLAADPLRVFLPVRLRPECGDAGDCADAVGAAPPLTPPDYDTLARDYTALRGDAAWTGCSSATPTADTSIADLTVTLVELFAHLGDLLHYRLDRIATEAWLSTARRRASVVRHARAVDFAVQPAISAAADRAGRGGRRPRAATRRRRCSPATPRPIGRDGRPDGVLLHRRDGRATVTVRASHAEVALYDWTEDDAVLGAGATSAVLVRPGGGGRRGLDGLAAGRLAARVRGGRRRRHRPAAGLGRRDGGRARRRHAAAAAGQPAGAGGDGDLRRGVHRPAAARPWTCCASSGTRARPCRRRCRAASTSPPAPRSASPGSACSRRTTGCSWTAPARSRRSTR